MMFLFALIGAATIFLLTIFGLMSVIDAINLKARRDERLTIYQ